MIWRKCLTAAGRSAVLELSRDPMGGKVGLVWGFSKLQAPTGCDSFKAYTIEEAGKVGGCALAWDWPGSHRYLSGLRFGNQMTARPMPTFWRNAFDCLLADVSHAWTSIGQENTRARRTLESGAKWLPRYEPRQDVITWFVPLGRKQAGEAGSNELDEELGIEAADWRYVAIAAGEGWAYRIGRILNRCGGPGVPPPNRPIRIGYFHPSVDQEEKTMGAVCRKAKGYDGIVVVLPDGGERAQRWAAAAPRMSWKWLSTLYSVSWKRDLPLPEVPPWKGLWL